MSLLGSTGTPCHPSCAKLQERGHSLGKQRNKGKPRKERKKATKPAGFRLDMGNSLWGREMLVYSHLRHHLAKHPNRVPWGTSYLLPSCLCVKRTLVLAQHLPHDRGMKKSLVAIPPGHLVLPKAWNSPGLCMCLWPLPCDAVTAPLTKGLLWAPVQQGDEIILMASSHLALLLLQLLLLLLQRCSCL